MEVTYARCLKLMQKRFTVKVKLDTVNILNSNKQLKWFKPGIFSAIVLSHLGYLKGGYKMYYLMVDGYRITEIMTLQRIIEKFGSVKAIQMAGYQLIKVEIERQVA